MTALERATRHVLEARDSSGCWQAGESPRVAMDAEDLLYHQFAGIRTSHLTAAAARSIRSRQDADGSWSGCHSGSGDLTVSVLAYTALRLAGDSPDAYHMALAAGWIRDAGGLASVGLAGQVWLAAFGQAEWEDLLVPPPEAIYLPPSHPVRVAGQPEWGRPTLIPLAVLGAIRPVRGLAFGLAELRVAADGRAREGSASVSRLPGLDRGLRAYRRSLHVAPLATARAAALRKCGDWIVAAQSQDGSWRGSRTGWLFSMMALELLGHRLGGPVLTRGLAALDTAAEWEGGSAPLRLETGSPSATRTALAVSALADAGLAGDDQALETAAAWLVEEELSFRSRWLAGRYEPSPGEAAKASGVPAGIGEMAAVALALRKVSLSAASGQLQATAFALRWLAGQQCKDGSWGRLGAAPASALATRLPLFDQGERRGVSAEVTACAVLALAAAGQPGSPAIRRGVAWMLRAQLPDGSWPGEQGTGDLLATAAVLRALIGAGVLAGKPPVARAVGWLLARQNGDGGWECPLSGGPSRPERPRPSAPLPTARGLLALLAAGSQTATDAAERAAGFLVGSQHPDGSWADLEADTAALSALGQFLARSPSGAPDRGAGRIAT